MQNRAQPNQNPNLLPGLNSYLTLGSMLLGTGLLVFGRNESHYDAAVYVLAVAGTSLFSADTHVRLLSITGGAMRFCYHPGVRVLGFFAQVGAMGSAAYNTLREGRPEVVAMQAQEENNAGAELRRR